jgi:nucleotide-binding universal stress UspA family protein
MAEPPLYPKVVVGYEENERGEDAKLLAQRIVAADGGGLETVNVAECDPAKTLGGMAERGEADLIVLGSTHRAAIGSVSPGSVAEHLLKGARARLVIAPKGYAKGNFAERLHVVAVGFDGMAESQAALDEAAELARRAHASMRVIAVATPTPQLGAAAAAQAAAQDAAPDFQTRLHDAVGELPAELRALPVFERGDPVERLLDRADQGVDLLVLGSRGFGPVMRLLLGSVSARVIREAPCPVMIVPRPQVREA